MAARAKGKKYLKLIFVEKIPHLISGLKSIYSHMYVFGRRSLVCGAFDKCITKEKCYNFGS